MTASEWDTRVLFAASRGCWWWNAWHPGRQLEMSGDAATREEAETALAAAITAAGTVGNGGPRP